MPECGGDFVHLADPPVRVGRQARYAAVHLLERVGLAVLEFGAQLVGQVHRRRRRKQRYLQRGGAFRQRGVAHLDARTPADFVADMLDAYAHAVQLGDDGRVLPGHIDARGIAAQGRAADDAAIHITPAGVCDNALYLARGLRRYGVALREHRALPRLAHRRRDPVRQAARSLRHKYGQYHIRLRNQQIH